MKRTDLAMIILIATVSVGVAYGVVGSIPALKAPSKAVKVKSIERYSANVDEPNGDVFNSQAINPTVDITIGTAAQTDETVGASNTTDDNGTESTTTNQSDSEQGR